VHVLVTRRDVRRNIRLAAGFGIDVKPRLPELEVAHLANLAAVQTDLVTIAWSHWSSARSHGRENYFMRLSQNGSGFVADA